MGVFFFCPHVESFESSRASLWDLTVGPHMTQVNTYNEISLHVSLEVQLLGSPEYQSDPSDIRC